MEKIIRLKMHVICASTFDTRSFHEILLVAADNLRGQEQEQTERWKDRQSSSCMLPSPFPDPNFFRQHKNFTCVCITAFSSSSCVPPPPPPHLPKFFRQHKNFTCNSICITASSSSSCVAS